MQRLLHSDQEVERLRRLDQYRIVRTPPERAFDDIVGLLADSFKAPIAFLSLTEQQFHWFKARIGIEIEEAPRSTSFCDHAINEPGIMVVPDANLDSRFEKSPMVIGVSHIRFHAGIALRDADGFAIGTLAVADTVPHEISKEQELSLERLARIALDAMEFKKAQATLQKTIVKSETARDQAVTYLKELRQVIDCLPQAIALLDKQSKLILWNKNYDVMFPEFSSLFKPGVTIESIYRTALRDERYYKPMSAHQEDIWVEKRLALFNQGGSIVEQNFGDGRWIRFDQHQTPDGKKVYVRTDITEEKNAADSFRLLFESNPVPMWVVDSSSQRYIDVNAAALEHYGYTREAFLNMTLVDIRPDREYERILEDARTKFGVDSGKEDWTHLKADGTEIIVTTYAKPIKYMDRDAALVAAIDVTERRKIEARIQYQAEHDPLTGLPNRKLFLELLGGALPPNAKTDYYTAIVLVDVDNFKGINDTLGHLVGDKLIVAVASRIEQAVGDRGVVARVGGDEFAILLSTLTDLKEAHLTSQHLITAFTKPLILQDREILVSVSAGLSFCINDTLPTSTLLMNADLALHRAKSDGRGVCRAYEPQMSLQMVMHAEVEQDLRRALAKNQLVVHYQPIIDLKKNAEAGFEALLRWNHPEKGAISPASFIPIAETSGLIVPIGEWVMEQSCLLANTLRDDLAIAVNISPVQFKAGRLVETVTSALKKTGLPAHRLELEITESILLEKTSDTLDVLKKLKDLGVKVVLDDFGTGYSGLGYLNSFPFDKIKIDRSFIKDLGITPKAGELVRAAINIGQSLGLTTLAEGIETIEQLSMLQALGCQQGQGFYFSRAVPESEIADKLKIQNNVASKRSVA